MALALRAGASNVILRHRRLGGQDVTLVKHHRAGWFGSSMRDTPWELSRANWEGRWQFSRSSRAKCLRYLHPAIAQALASGSSWGYTPAQPARDSSGWAGTPSGSPSGTTKALARTRTGYYAGRPAKGL